MFHTLIASGSQPPPSIARFLCSVMLHGIVVAAAIVATRGSAPASPSPARESTTIFIAPEPPSRSLPREANTAPSGIGSAPAGPVMLEAPTLSVAQLSPSLPTVSDLLSQVASRSSPTAPATAAGGGDAPWTADAVDDPVQVLDQAPVRYPPALAQAAIAGRVELEFVVDTSGWAEDGSFRTLASTRPEFAAAARAAIMQTRYRPARARGQVVRQLVRQALSFRPEDGLSRVR